MKFDPALEYDDIMQSYANHRRVMVDNVETEPAMSSTTSLSTYKDN